MPVHLGIDLGTSSVKCVLLSDDGKLLASSQVPYPIERPRQDWAEQSPQQWWATTAQAVRSVLGQSPDRVPSSVGLSGQMHGVVLVDRRRSAVRPAIIWPDARTTAEVDDWSEAVGDRFVSSTCGMPIACGLAGISLTWLARHEPDAIQRAVAVLQPKDWIRLCLTGELALEPTDACASLLFSVVDEKPVPELVQLAGVQAGQLPAMVPTLSVAGVVSEEGARETGLRPGTPVAAGGGDQAMAALALGLDDPCRAAISISSSGTAIVPIPGDATSLERQSLEHHVIAGARSGERIAMGVVLAAGLGTRWLAEHLLRDAGSESQLLAAADGLLPGADGLSANPHFGGTRTPVVDGRAQGAFVGLGFQHTPTHLMRAVVDGVALSLTGSVRTIEESQQPVREIVLSGGGARFPVWHRAIADASGLPVVLSSDLDHSPVGAALAGAMAIDEPVRFTPRSRVEGHVEPDPERVAAFREARERAVQRGLLPPVSAVARPEVSAG